jgi:hypothetical protein
MAKGLKEPCTHVVGVGGVGGAVQVVQGNNLHQFFYQQL